MLFSSSSRPRSGSIAPALLRLLVWDRTQPRIALRRWLWLALAVGMALDGPAIAQETQNKKPTHNLAQGKLPRQVLQTLQQAQVPTSALSVLITPLPNSQTSNTEPRHLSHQAQASVNPASVM